MPDFLLEIGTEEIPARMIDSAREELAQRVSAVLQRERLADRPAVDAFSTPRRLAILATAISARQPDVSQQVIGPSAKVAYKDGTPTSAAEAFARKNNIPIESLERVATPKGEYIAATVLQKGRSASEILAESLPKEIAGIYWPKSMYWRGKNTERFVRPVRWMVSLLDSDVIPLDFAGIQAGATSQGHRILSAGPLPVNCPSEYASTLARGYVIVRSAEREALIRKALDTAARNIAGARWREDKPLLDTVVNLTEFPSVIVGSFDPEFLSLPDEVLVTVMRDHQKYFALENFQGRLLPHFLAVLNTSGDPDGLICHGNERVLRARFNDARFFWQTDQKTTLRRRVDSLKSVTFQKDLGSYFDKTIRMQKLGSLISEALRSADTAVRPGVVHKAALLAKTDLTTELVKEFTELQGIVGGLYARHQQLDPSLPAQTAAAIADAIYDQYKPESMDDEVPRSAEGAVLAIADKADSIAGMFALGLQPSGSRDPFALRRAANGIVRIIAEHKLPLPISKLFADARAQYSRSQAEKRFVQELDFDRAIANFMRERLEFYLREVRGFGYEVVNAVLAAGSNDVVDAIARAEAVSLVRGSDDFASISVAFKRMKNILRQAQEKGIAAAAEYQASDADDAERQLASHAAQMAPQFQASCHAKDYTGGLVQLSTLRKPIDVFFDKVMVMVDEEDVRANRLALLRNLLREFSTIADFSEIGTETKSS